MKLFRGFRMIRWFAPAAMMLSGMIAFTFPENTARADIVASWNLVGAGGPTFGPSTLTPSLTDPNVTVGPLTRGPGLTTSGTGAGNAFGANGWNGPSDAAGAVVDGNYITFSFAANSGYELSLSSFDPYNIRRSATGPSTGQWQFSLDGSSFTDIGSPITWGGVTTSSGNTQSALDLSGISALQSIPDTTTVTFRVANYNSTNPSGTWYFNGASGPNTFVVNGVLMLATGGGDFPYWDANGSDPGVGGSGTWDTTSSLWNSAEDGSGANGAFSTAVPARFTGAPGNVSIGSGGVTADAGVQFDVDGYNVSGDSLTLGNSNNTIAVTNAGQTATINSQVLGSSGLTKTGAGTLALGTTVGYSGDTIVSEGLLSMQEFNPGTETSANATVSSGAGLTANNIRVNSLAVDGTVTVNADGGTSVVQSLTMGGSGKFDLSNNSLVVNHAGDSPLMAVRASLLSGRGGEGFGATWAGDGIMSSTAQADPLSLQIGYGENSAMPFGAFSTFEGVAVDDTAVLVKFTRGADATLDGVVNDDDVTIAGLFYDPSWNPIANGPRHWFEGDFTYDGIVNDDDITLLGLLYDPSAPALSSAFLNDSFGGAFADAFANGQLGQMQSVPEPSSVTIIAIGVSTLFLKRRKLLRKS